MKIHIAPDITYCDEIFLKRAFETFSTIDTLTILRQLVGGKTTASVFLVDIESKNNPSSDIRIDDILRGQFVLKLDERNKEWSAEPSESERHQKAEIWDVTGKFASEHIPKLRHCFEEDNKLAMLYDVAGLSRLRICGYQNLGAGNHAECCYLLSTSILEDFNAKYNVESGVSARQSLEAWLGYRLDPNQAKGLYGFANTQTAGRQAFAVSGKVYLNPLWVCNIEAISNDKTHTRFLGLQHGDLHTGNIFFDLFYPLHNPFWIIDWALSRECPLFFDHAYFELSLILKELSGKPHERLNGLLDFADSEQNADIPQEHMALATALSNIRKSLNTWQKHHESNRIDSFDHQILLARVAVGLNWANKPLETSDRRLAFEYSARAATDFMKRFHMDKYNEAIRDADTVVYVETSAHPTATESPSDELWNDCWQKLAGFNDSEYVFVLITGDMRGQPESSCLGFLPWSIVFDFDAQSEVTGLHAAASEVLNKRRSLCWFGKDLLPVNFQRGTAWMMTNGWSSRREDTPTEDTWRRVYLRKIRELSSSLRAGTSPKLIKVILLPDNTITDNMLERLIEGIDEELGDSAEFILVDNSERGIAKHGLIKHVFLFSGSVFIQKLQSIFGSAETTTNPQIPGLYGSVDIPPDTLRNWEEDFDLIHSLILEFQKQEDSADSKFLRGMPPTWLDLAANLDVERDVSHKLLAKLEGRFEDVRGFQNFSVELFHSPGAGGTTAAFRAAWQLRTKYPVLVLRRYSRLTADRIDAVYQRSQKPILLVSDASDLPATSKGDLFRELARRNVRIGIVYLIRSVNRETDKSLHISDPMSPVEAERFLEVFLPRCKNERNRNCLRQIANQDNTNEELYRSAFFFGLTAFEDEFLSIDRYVRTHLISIAPLARQTLLYLSIVTRYSQKGLSDAFFRRLFQPAIFGDIVLARALGQHPAKLVVHARDRVKIIHPLIAEEILRQLVGGDQKDAWKENLKDICVQLIREVVAIVGPYSEEGKELFEQLFIYRDQWADSDRIGRRQFSPLLDAIDNVDAQQQILTLLTEEAELEPHYWNHRGRHLIYKTNESFPKAEIFLLKAVELSSEKDPLHFHGLGMVRRFWVKHLLDEIFRRADDATTQLTPEIILEEIGCLATSALEAFAKARELDPEDDHGYITAIQTVIMIAERLCQASGESSIAALCTRQDEVGRWLQEHITESEQLLTHVRHFRGRQNQSRHEGKCEFDLNKLYGDFDELIETWERILDRSMAHSWLRKAMTHAYLTRRNRMWSSLTQEELRKIVELSECNLSFDPTSEADLRTWFQAYRFLPEFSFNEAIARLQGWASRSDSVDAHYYLYILHFLRWKAGGERDELLIQRHLQKSAQLAIGRRDNSYEWFAREPHWCPLVNFRELGKWDDQKKFFRNQNKLSFVEGTITALKRTGGIIKIGATTRAFFVPPPHIRESEHINAQVHFFLGFTYEQLRAWSVDLGPVPPQIDEEQERQALRSQVATLISVLIDRNDKARKMLQLPNIGKELRERFPDGEPVFRRLGFQNLTQLIRSYPDFEVILEDSRWIAKYRREK